MSDSDKLAAILKMADPSSNSSYQERKVALNKAHEIMDRTGMSYASVGMSQADAERIEIQFSVAVGGNQRKEKASLGLNLFKQNTQKSNTGIQKREPETIFVPWSTTPKKTVKKEEPTESYVERCEREERARWDKQYDDMVAYQKEEAVKQKNEKALADKFVKNATVVMVLFFIGFLFWVFSQIGAT